MAKITIDGKQFEVKDGTNVVDAAEANGVDIPHYCYHPGFRSQANVECVWWKLKAIPNCKWPAICAAPMVEN